MHINRDAEPVLKSLFTDFPVVTVVGPRQSGKTTLVRETFPSFDYVNLEDIGVIEKLEYDPKGFLRRFENGAIFDEVQRFPKLLSYLQVMVDVKGSNGQFVLTGSNQQALSNAVSQSLAGRTAILTLMPLAFYELAAAGIKNDIDQQLYQGFYPKIYKDSVEPRTLYQNYVQTYIERDVRQILNIPDLSNFKKFMKLCAGRIGQLFNFNSMANELGMSQPTIKSWISVLEASFILKTIAPFYKNFGKRLVKTPKLYFTDIGVAAYLLGINNAEQMSRDPLRGQLFENLVIMDLYKQQLNMGQNLDFYFYRDHNQNEVDLLVPTATTILPIEIKSGETFNPRFLRGLEYYNKYSSVPKATGAVIYTGSNDRIGEYDLLNYQDAAIKVFSDSK